MALLMIPFIFLLVLLPFLSFSLPLQPPPTLPSSNNILLQKTCNSTTYYDFCVASLSSSPQSSSAADVKTLSAIAIGIAINNATDTSNFASTMSKTTKNSRLAALFGACADKYVHAREALRSSLEELSQENYDYANVHVSSAAEYPNVCRRLFMQSKAPAVAYPAEMGRREVVLERLCTVSLDMISLLG